MNPSSAKAQEIRAEAGKWSLDGDAKLLEYMREISRKLELQCQETELKINRMCLSGEELNVELGNATNRLLALQHTQFVENRVQEDEDVGGGVKTEGQGPPEVRQMSPMSTLKSVLADSVACLHGCYEKIEVELEEDSEEEDEPGRSVAFRPRDPYVHRPLPFVIGSKEFKEKWHVGLVDSESDSANEEEAQFSDSSESGQSVSLPSGGGSEADSVWGLQTTSNALAHKSASQVSSEDERSPKVSHHPGEVFNPVPAQRAYFQPPKLTPRTNPPISSSPPLVPSTSKPPGLFDDLEGDDFDAPAPKSVSKPPPFFREATESRKTVNLFDEEPPEFEAPPQVAQKTHQRGLFLDSDHEEDFPAKEAPANLFSEEPPADDFQDDDEFDSFMSSLKKAPEKVAKPKLSNLFDDDDEPEDFLDTLLKGAKSKVKPQPAKRVVPKAEPPKETLKSKKISLFDDSEEEDMFAGVGKKTEPTEEPSRSPETSKEEKAPLFAEEEPPPVQESPEEVQQEEEETVAERRKSPEEQEKEILIQEPPQKCDEVKSVPDNLFETEAEPEDWLEASPSFQPPPASSLFNEPPEDEVPEVKESKLPGLFDDFEEKPTSIPLFDDLPPDDDLFVDRKEVFYDDFADSFPPEVTSVNPTGNSYLFNDEPPLDDWQARDEPDEIFSSVRNLIKSHEKPENPPEEPVNKPKIVPNKLNKAMAINVAALLPGAKRPSFKNVQETPEEEKAPEPDDSGLLTNLNRNRAKIPQRRKPSTRRGRQETYRKSLILENDAESHNSMPEEPEKNHKLPDDLFGDRVAETEPKAQEKSSKMVKSASKSLFDSDDDDDSDIFATRQGKHLPKSTSEPTKITPKPTSLFGDSDEEDDDLFGASSKINSVKIAPSRVEKKIAKKSAAGDDPLADLF